MNSPGLILADEPTGNLDERTGNAVIDLLLGLCASAHGARPRDPQCGARRKDRGGSLVTEPPASSGRPEPAGFVTRARFGRR